MAAGIELASMLRIGAPLHLTFFVCAPVTFCWPKKSPKMPFVSLAWVGRLYSLLLVTTSKFIPEFYPSVIWNLNIVFVDGSAEIPAFAGMTRGIRFFILLRYGNTSFLRRQESTPGSYLPLFINSYQNKGLKHCGACGSYEIMYELSFDEWLGYTFRRASTFLALQPCCTLILLMLALVLIKTKFKTRNSYDKQSVCISPIQAERR